MQFVFELQFSVAERPKRLGSARFSRTESVEFVRVTLVNIRADRTSLRTLTGTRLFSSRRRVARARTIYYTARCDCYILRTRGHNRSRGRRKPTINEKDRKVKNSARK